MAISLKHSFQSAKADGADTSLVRPSDWNAEHTLTQATNRLLGRTTAGTGATEEISVGSGLTFSAGSLSADVTSVAGKTGAVTLAVADVSGAVAKAGDTMTGALSLPSNGLTVGTNQLLVSGGNVGIGTTSPGTRLEVQGGTSAAILGQSSSNYGVYGISASSVAGRFECSGSNIGVSATSVGSYGIDGRTSSGSYAGVIGFSSNTSIYGLLGHQATYGVYSNGQTYSTGNTTLAGLLYNSGHGTTASAANVFINSTSGLISRSTSSLLYKKDVEPLWDSVGDKLLDAKPIFYRSNELTDDNTAWSWYSFGAEELGQLDPRFVLWGYEPKRDANGNVIYTYTLDEEGNQLKGPPEMEDEMSPNGIHTNAVLAAAINLIQRQHATIEALEARVSALEGN